MLTFLNTLTTKLAPDAEGGGEREAGRATGQAVLGRELERPEHGVPCAGWFQEIPGGAT